MTRPLPPAAADHPEASPRAGEAARADERPSTSLAGHHSAGGGGREGMRCCYVQDGEHWTQIPACWGSAVGGPDNCTCGIEGSRLERAEAARLAAEIEIERLREKIVRLNHRAQADFNDKRLLRARIRELEGVAP